jgi:hypothetical protein
VRLARALEQLINVRCPVGSALKTAVRELLIMEPARVRGTEYTLPDLLAAIPDELSIEEVVVAILQATQVKVSWQTIRSWARDAKAEVSA